jgi:spermidine/putrescine transport system ATP-binding protein
MVENAVQLRGVSKHFGSVAAVEDVSLTIGDGEFFSLLGPSGCGKTTTLRLIAGFELPDRGEVFIGGKLQGETPPYKRPANTVFQNYALFPHMRVGENVAFGLQMRKVPREEIRRRVSEALEMVRLPGLEHRKPDQLSGGQQQRVALARALVNEPEVLLLDEPLGALDLKLRKEMQLELKNLQERVGITFVYVTHDQEEALTMSDRIAVMKGGRVLQVDAPHRIYERPVNRFVADFIGDTNFLVGVVKGAGRGTATVAVDGELPLRIEVERIPLHEEEVTVAIRPEKISLHAQPPDDRAVQGRVEEVVYFGTNTCYLVKLTERTTVTVRRQNEQVGQDLSFAEGAQVYLHWQPESARLLTG